MTRIHPSSLVVLFSIPLMLVYMWHLDQFNSTWLEKKETFAFASRKPIFHEQQVRKKQPKKKRSRKPKPVEEKDELGKNKLKPRV